MAVAKQPLHVHEMKSGLRSLCFARISRWVRRCRGNWGFCSGGMRRCWACRISFSVHTSDGSSWSRKYIREVAYLHRRVYPSPRWADTRVCSTHSPTATGVSEGAGRRDSFSHFSFTLLVADTGRLKTRGKSRTVKVMFHNNIFEAGDTPPRMSFTGAR